MDIHYRKITKLSKVLDKNALTLATDIVNDHKLQTIDEYRQMNDWPQWTEATLVELTSRKM